MTPKTGLPALALALAFALGSAPPALAASLTVATITLPRDAQDFTYVAAGTPSITLDDDADARHAASRTIPGLLAGQYEIVESPVAPGFTLVNVSCRGAEGPAALDRTARKVTVRLISKSETSCSFLHTKVAP